MIAAVVFDSWKLSFFEAILKREGFEYTRHGSFHDAHIITLSVETTSPAELAPFVTEANFAAAKSRMN